MLNLTGVLRGLSIFVILFGPLFSQAIPTKGHKIMISAVSPHAVEAGKEIARKGGNVVDVSVAVALTLAVTHPYYSALGGGGFALVKLGKTSVTALDFREKAPAQTSPSFYLGKNAKASINGGSAIAVPGIPAGLWALHRKYGKLSWKELFPEPIRLAQKGFPVSGAWVYFTKLAQSRFNSDGKKTFLKDSKEVYLPGEVIKQRALAKALKEIKNGKAESFYQGRVAKDLVKSVKKAGGVMTLQDLKDYKVRWLTPLETMFQGYKVYLMPPPSSGGVVIQSALAMIDQLQLKKYEPFSVIEFHMLGEILNRSFRGRSVLGDPDFYKNPVDHLLSKQYLSKMAKSIERRRSKKVAPLSEAKINKESAETTHISVLDRLGNGVAMTLTLNGAYGSGVVSEKYGIALNNQMDDFTTRPGQPNLWGLTQGKANQVEPGKRPLSSMSPTLVADDKNQIVMSVGSPGGPTIISAVLQILYRVFVTGLDMDQAIQAPRVHNQFSPPTLYVEQNRFAPETLTGLQKRKHKVELRPWVGRVYGVRKNKEGILEAAYDSRGEGAAGGQ